MVVIKLKNRKKILDVHIDRSNDYIIQEYSENGIRTLDISHGDKDAIEAIREIFKIDPIKCCPLCGTTENDLNKEKIDLTISKI